MEAQSMSTLTSGPDLGPAVDRASVEAALRERWVPPVAAAAITATACGGTQSGIDELARATLDTMLTRQYRVGPMPPEDDCQELLRRVRHWVAGGKPVHVMMGYAPMKNPNTVRRPRADWAEFFALCHLCAWHNKVCGVYPPGLRIKIVFDDSTIRMANRHSRGPMDAYIRSVGRLIAALGYQSFLVGTMRQSWFAWLFHFGPYQIARRRVLRWEQDPANREALERMTEFAARNLAVPSTLSGSECRRCCEQAAHRYRVYWEALQLSGFSRLGHKLIAMYLDGHQHHLRADAALHLTSLGKGLVVQPWQGEGALLDNGHAKLIPTVLTAGRREKLATQTVGGLSLVPQDGFDAIDVCWETAASGERPQAAIERPQAPMGQPANGLIGR
jgi:hypothetical protein